VGERTALSLPDHRPGKAAGSKQGGPMKIIGLILRAIGELLI
jgi:hypothetical protein